MYRSTRKPDARLQDRHTRLNELLAETMTVRDAAARYGVSPVSLQTALRGRPSWRPGAYAPRYYISDIELVVGEIRRRMEPGYSSRSTMKR